MKATSAKTEIRRTGRTWVSVSASARTQNTNPSRKSPGGTLVLVRPLSPFSLRDWFERTFEAPTAAQERGWPAIASGGHTLIQAPTGSGKTLAAFLWALDQARPGEGTQVLYVSPLKALNYDVERNPDVSMVRLGDVSDDELRRVLGETSAAMRSGPRRRFAYGRAPRSCLRCGTPVAVRRQGDDARAAYWCPGCQPLARGRRVTPEGGTQRAGA